MFSISTLKKHLGPGLGLRKNKYLLEIPMPGIDGSTINVLCRSTGLPERNITTTEVFHKGRKCNLRGETDYIGTFEISILDDSNMNIRKKFDSWITHVDNSRINSDTFSGSSYESGVGEALSLIQSGISVANKIDEITKTNESLTNAVGGFFLGVLDGSQAAPVAKYQTDINVWQLNASEDKIYGYKLQNAFPSSIGIVTLDDGAANELSEFSVVFTFSEFITLENATIPSQLLSAVLGPDVNNIIRGVERYNS